MASCLESRGSGVFPLVGAIGSPHELAVLMDCLVVRFGNHHFQADLRRPLVQFGQSFSFPGLDLRNQRCGPPNAGHRSDVTAADVYVDDAGFGRSGGRELALKDARSLFCQKIFEDLLVSFVLFAS